MKGRVKLITIFMIMGCTLTTGHHPVFAQSKQDNTIENKKEQQTKLQEDIKFLDNQIKQTQKSHSNTISELKLIQKKADLRKRLIDKISADIVIQEREIENKSRTIAALQTQIDTLAKHYKQTLFKAYQNRDTRLWFTYILASNSLEQGYRRWAYLKNYTKNLNKQALSIKRVQEELETQREELAQIKEQKEKEQSVKTNEYEQLKKDETATKKKAQNLVKQQNSLKKELQQKKQQADRLNKEIQRMIAAAIKSEKSTTSGKSSSKGSYINTPESYKLDKEFEDNKGKLPWPVKKGVVIERFGENPHPTLKGVKLPFNNGINISAPRGCNVLSVFNGVVRQIIYIPGYNNCVLVSHGNYFTFYCKLGKVNVKANQKVTTGQIIGTLENTSVETELHFEIWKGTQKQNPDNWLKQ